MENFEQGLLNGTIKPPTQRGFTLDKWNEIWESIKNPNERERDLYFAGTFIFEQLEAVRTALNKLYNDHAPKTTYRRLLKLYCALSNRDAYIILNQSKSPCETKGNIFSQTTKKNKFQNEVSREEVAVGCVDGLELAISACLRNISKNANLPPSKDSISELRFIEIESELSQIYSVNEDYWHSILYRNFIFKNEDETKITITQPSTPHELAYLVSHTRRLRLKATDPRLPTFRALMFQLDEQPTLAITGSGRSRRLKVGKVKDLSQTAREKNFSFELSSAITIGELSEEIFATHHTEEKFTLRECLESFRLLTLIAESYIDRFPKNDESLTPGKLIEFCPSLNKIELISAISKATKLSFRKTTAIIEFLTYTPSTTSDLWAQPLIPIDNNTFAFLFSAAIAPIIDRVVERWLVKLGVDLTIKGDPYERKVLEEISLAREQCDYQDIVSKPESRTISINGTSEQIDLVLKIGNNILIGELKSIVSTDSSVSFHRTIATLKHAANQAKRKSQFIEDNIDRFFHEMNWSIEKDRSYKIIPIILNSNKIHAGFPIESIPVVDERIISAYLTSNTFPLLSIFEEEKPRHVAKFILYKNLNEFISNLDAYLKHPPQTLGDLSWYEYKSVRTPHHENKTVEFKRLIPRNIQSKEYLSKTYPFDLETSHDIEEQLNNIHVLI